MTSAPTPLPLPARARRPTLAESIVPNRKVVYLREWLASRAPWKRALYAAVHERMVPPAA
jgi:hypothetical protein